jgi:hypothetical protein
VDLDFGATALRPRRSNIWKAVQMEAEITGSPVRRFASGMAPKEGICI